MLHTLWNVILYQPLVNALALLVSFIPGGDVGFAVIILTIVVKLILFPLSQHQIRNQAAMNILAPELNRIKASGASKEEQARKTFELYKKHKANPLSGCLVVIPTIFVFIALYRVFIQGINFDSGLLYSFVHIPEHVNTMFLGLVDVSKRSIVLAILAGVSQYFQAFYMPKPPVPTDASPDSFQASFSKSMTSNMKYGLPVLIFVLLGTNWLGVSLSGAVALYWITSNIFTVGQQIYVNRTEKQVLTEEARVLS